VTVDELEDMKLNEYKEYVIETKKCVCLFSCLIFSRVKVELGSVAIVEIVTKCQGVSKTAVSFTIIVVYLRFKA